MSNTFGKIWMEHPKTVQNWSNHWIKGQTRKLVVSEYKCPSGGEKWMIPIQLQDRIGSFVSN